MFQSNLKNRRIVKDILATLVREAHASDVAPEPPRAGERRTWGLQRPKEMDEAVSARSGPKPEAYRRRLEAYYRRLLERGAR